MKEFKIVELLPYGQYILQDAKGEKQSLIMEFYIDEQPAVGDKLIIHEMLLDRTSPSFCQPYAFGKLEDGHGRSKIQLQESELIALHTKTGDFVLKRIYG